MPIVLGGSLCALGAVLIGLAYHDTYGQAWNVLLGVNIQKDTPSKPLPDTPDIQDTPYTRSHGVA